MARVLLKTPNPIYRNGIDYIQEYMSVNDFIILLYVCRLFHSCSIIVYCYYCYFCKVFLAVQKKRGKNEKKRLVSCFTSLKSFNNIKQIKLISIGVVWVLGERDRVNAYMYFFAQTILRHSMSSSHVFTSKSLERTAKQKRDKRRQQQNSFRVSTKLIVENRPQNDQWINVTSNQNQSIRNAPIYAHCHFPPSSTIHQLQ